MRVLLRFVFDMLCSYVNFYVRMVLDIVGAAVVTMVIDAVMATTETTTTLGL